MVVKLAGAVKHFNLFFTEIKKLQQYPFTFNVYDGVDFCKWNGGRINTDNTIQQYMIDFYNKHNIGVYFTFSNSVIDLNDETGNRLLEMLNHNPLNGVICVNDALRQYIRDIYPEYNIIYSITGHPNDISITKELINYYKDLESKYNLIVPRFEMGLNPDFYNHVDTSKYELIVNDTCIYGCKQFNDHFEAINKLNSNHSKPYDELGYEVCHKIHECWVKNFNPDIGSEHDRQKYGDSLGMDFTESMYKKAISLGYTHFKIMGRENLTLNFRNELYGHLDTLKSTL